MKNNGYIRLLFVLFINILFFAPSIKEAQSEGDRIAAIVNDEIITESELVRSRIFPNKSFSFLIEKKLQLQVAKKKGVFVSQQEVLSAIEDLKRKSSFKSDQEFEETLQKEGSSLEGYKRDLTEQLTLIKLINREISSKITLNDKEIEEYYSSHKERFSLPEEIRIGSIYIPFKSSDPIESIQRAQKIMKNILADLKDNNASFMDIKKRYSEPLQVYVNDDLGYVRKGEILKELESIAFSLKEGDNSDLIETSGGLYIVKVLEKRKTGFIPFQDVKDVVKDLLFQEKSERVYKEWLYEIKSSAYIEII